MFLEISQNLEENTCARFSFLIKLQVPSLQVNLKRDSGSGVFLWIFGKFLRTPFSQNTCGRLRLDKQHFLAENPSKVLNGQQQHKGVIFHWSRLVPRWLSCFKVLHYDHLLLCRENAAWGMQWRYREKRNDQEHHENVSFFI